jgi:heme exporter protein C
MNNQNIFQRLLFSENKFLNLYFPVCSLLLLGYAQYYVFMVVPDEKIMGAVQRIFYFHVGSAMAAYAMLAVMFFASSWYLATKENIWDQVSEAAASVGFMFCSIVLASGMIWGHSSWNTWWRWEPRLVSFLILWLMLFSYVALRMFSKEHVLNRNVSAVLGILSAINVPIVIFSIKLLDATEQLHPEVVAKQGLVELSYVTGLLLSIFALILFAAVLMRIKVRLISLEQRLLTIEEER